METFQKVMESFFFYFPDFSFFFHRNFCLKKLFDVFDNSCGNFDEDRGNVKDNDKIKYDDIDICDKEFYHDQNDTIEAYVCLKISDKF